MLIVTRNFRSYYLKKTITEIGIKRSYASASGILNDVSMH